MYTQFRQTLFDFFDIYVILLYSERVGKKKIYFSKTQREELFKHNHFSIQWNVPEIGDFSDRHFTKGI